MGGGQEREAKSRTMDDFQYGTMDDDKNRAVEENERLLLLGA